MSDSEWISEGAVVQMVLSDVDKGKAILFTPKGRVEMFIGDTGTVVDNIPNDGTCLVHFWRADVRMWVDTRVLRAPNP